MDTYLFKVQISLFENVEVFYVRVNHSSAVENYLYKFKNNLVQRYDALSKTPFKIMWLDHEGDKISIFTEEDLQICMKMKARKLFIEADDVSNRNDNKFGTENFHPFIPSRGSDLTTDSGYRGLASYLNESNPNHNSNAAPRVNSQPSSVQCDDVLTDVMQDCQYICSECHKFGQTKKLQGGDDVLRMDDLSFDDSVNSQTMMKEHCEEQSKESHGDVPANVITDIAKSMATVSTTPSNENTIVVQDNGNDSAAETGVKQILTDTLCKAFSNLINKSGVLEALTSPELKNTQFKMTVSLNPRKTTEKTNNDILQLTQPTKSLVIFDPCELHEVISAIPTYPQSNQTQSGEPKSNESQESAEKMHCDCDVPESQSTLLSGSVVPISPAVFSPTPDDITIKDVIETPTADDNDVESRDSFVEHRDSNTISDWTLVDGCGHVESDQPKHTGAIPKVVTAPVATDNIGSVAARALPMRNTYRSKSSQKVRFLVPEEYIYHSNPIINKGVITMMSMGFSNDGDGLTRLLERVNGNISLALDALQ